MPESYWVTLRRIVRTTSVMADLLASARFTPLGVISVLARGFDTWHSAKPHLTECFSGWTRVHVPHWETFRKTVVDRGDAETIANDSGDTAQRVILPEGEIGWVDYGRWTTTPLVPAGQCTTKTERMMSDYLWSCVGNHGVLTQDRNGYLGLQREMESCDLASRFSIERAREISRYNARGRFRSELFVGVPGSGKSVCARSVAKTLGGRSLSVPAKIMGRWSDAAGLIEALRPEVIVVHDIDKGDLKSVLTDLETFNKVANVIATANSRSLINEEATRPGRFNIIREAPVTLGELGVSKDWLTSVGLDLAELDPRVLAMPISFALEYHERQMTLGDAHDGEASILELQERAKKAEEDAKSVTKPAESDGVPVK